MQYDQLPLPIDARMYPREWRALGYALLICPGCDARVSYPANTTMYAVVCKCGWFTSPDEENCIFWYPPTAAKDGLKERFEKSNSNN